MHPDRAVIPVRPVASCMTRDSSSAIRVIAGSCSSFRVGVSLCHAVLLPVLFMQGMYGIHPRFVQSGRKTHILNQGLLCYILTWLSGLVFFLIEKDSKFVKFHAMQSIITFVALIIIIWIANVIPLIGRVIAGLVGLLMLVLWIILMIKAYQGEKFKLPVVGDLAEKWSA